MFSQMAMSPTTSKMTVNTGYLFTALFAPFVQLIADLSSLRMFVPSQFQKT